MLPGLVNKALRQSSSPACWAQKYYAISSWLSKWIACQWHVRTWLVFPMLNPSSGNCAHKRWFQYPNLESDQRFQLWREYIFLGWFEMSLLQLSFYAALLRADLVKTQLGSMRTFKTILYIQRSASKPYRLKTVSAEPNFIHKPPPRIELTIILNQRKDTKVIMTVMLWLLSQSVLAILNFFHWHCGASLLHQDTVFVKLLLLPTLENCVWIGSTQRLLLAQSWEMFWKPRI